MGGNANEVRLWGVAADAPAGPTLAHGGTLQAAAFSPDGKTLLLTSSPGEAARLWDTATGQPVGAPFRHNGVKDVVLSPDGRTVLAPGEDNTARLWETATGKPASPPLPHGGGGPILAAAFSPDGRTVLTTTTGSVVRLWDAATGRAVGPPRRNQGVAGLAAFSPDGRTFLLGSPDGKVRLWPAPAPLTGSVDRLVLWTQVLTGMELDADGVAHALDTPTWLQRRQELERLGGPPLP
jgi:eukaryotic-like serine/threonine-protein kinase